MDFFRPTVQIPDNVLLLGTVSKDLAIHSPTQSDKVPTTIQSEVFPTTVCPPPLHKFGDKDPLAIAISKYSNIPKAFDPDTLVDCSNDLSEAILCYCRPLIASKRQWMTDQEIFGGIPDVSTYPSINLLTSEGYPLCLIRSFGKEEYYYFQKKGKDMKGKNWLFDYTLSDKGRILHEIHPSLREIMETNFSLRQKGIQPLSIFISTLKDQCIPIEKAKEFKVRVFSNSSIQDTWQTKKYFGHWQAAYTAARFSNESAIGINAESFEWSDLYKRLIQKGNNIITGDYRAFGDTLARDCMWEAYNIIENWYKFYYGNEEEYEECRQQRFMLFESMCSSPHMARNVLFRKIAGIPSGFALTVEINDLVNKLYIRYIFIKLTNRSLSDFRRYTYLCTYGDDMIWSINDSLKEEIDFKKVKDEFEKLDILFTPATKDDKEYRFLNIYEATFLKGKFVPHPFRRGVFLRLMPYASCLECLNWKNKSVPEDCYLYQAFRVCLRYLHAYGPDIYSQYRQKMLNVVIKYSDILFPVDFKPDLPTWRKLDDILFGNR